MGKINLKTPISYYGGKQKLAEKILSVIPDHVLYCEPFLGGAAVFFAKRQSEIEVLNDTNRELINFYKTVQNDFVGLEREIRISLHSRDMHTTASVIYNYPRLFSEIKRAWQFGCYQHKVSAQSWMVLLASTSPTIQRLRK